MFFPLWCFYSPCLRNLFLGWLTKHLLRSFNVLSLDADISLPTENLAILSQGPLSISTHPQNLDFSPYILICSFSYCLDRWQLMLASGLSVMSCFGVCVTSLPALLTPWISRDILLSSLFATILTFFLYT